MNRSLTLITFFALFAITVSGQVSPTGRDLITEKPAKPSERQWERNIRPGSEQTGRAKAMSEAKQKLDRLTYESYNSADSLWFGDSRSEYFYDDRGNSTSSLFYSWNGTTSSWKLEARDNVTFNDQGKWTLDVEDLWIDSTGEWFTYYKGTAEYDENGRIGTTFSYRWDNINNLWINNSKGERGYNANGLMVLAEFFDWDLLTNAWVPTDKNEYGFDNEGNEILTIYSEWDKTNGQYVYVDKYETTFNITGNPVTLIYSTWDVQSGAWLPSYKEDEEYENNRLVRWINSTWSASSATWVIQERGEYEYDSLGNRIQSLGYLYDSATDQWNNNFKRAYSFNTSVLVSEVYLPYWMWISGFEVNEFTGSILSRWVDSLSSWVPVSRSTYEFSDIDGSGIQEELTPSLRIYPNPATDRILIVSDQSLDSASFELYDARGRKILSQVLSGNTNTVPIGAFARGSYYFRIVNGQANQTGQVVIR